MLLMRRYTDIQEVTTNTPTKINNNRELALIMALREKSKHDQRLFHIAINAIASK